MVSKQDDRSRGYRSPLAAADVSLEEAAPQQNRTGGSLPQQSNTVLADFSGQYLDLHSIAALVPTSDKPRFAGSYHSVVHLGVLFHAPDYVSHNQNFTLSVTRNVSRNFTVDLRYVGTVGKKQQGSFNQHTRRLLQQGTLGCPGNHSPRRRFSITGPDAGGAEPRQRDYGILPHRYLRYPTGRLNRPWAEWLLRDPGAANCVGRPAAQCHVYGEPCQRQLPGSGCFAEW